MLTTVYLVLSTVLLFFIFAAWSKRGILNVSIKFTFLGAAVLGTVELLRNLGFIIQI